MKCLLIVGHKASSPGAVNRDSGMTEFEFNDKLAKRVVSELENTQILYRKSYRLLPKLANAQKADFIVSMHCNAFNTRASGSEVLYYHRSVKSKAIAEIFQESFVNNLSTTNRGVKGKSSEDRGGYLLKETKPPCIITEAFFIDNNAELNLININYEGLVRAYIESIKKTFDYLQSV